MSLTVREALSLNILKEAEVVAGRGGLDNPIRWTHILDHPQVAEWVKGGEVLITSGLGIQDDAEAQAKYMREAAMMKVAAVFVAKEEYMPHTTPVMREIADRHDLPLVELPRATPFIEVTEAILRQLATRSLDAERDYLIDALLAGNLPASEETIARLAELGLEPEQHHVLALAERAAPTGDQLLSEQERRAIWAALKQAPRRAVLVDRPAWVIAIFPVSAREGSSVPFARSLGEAIKEHSRTGVRIGVGRLVRRLPDFPTSFREAREALFIASITGETKSVLHYNDLGVWRLLLRIEDETELGRFIDHYLSAVARHDREQQTDWLRTLETFLDLNGNLRATARALALHRNTVSYQLEHISKLLGQDLNSPEVRLNLQVALRASRLLAARARGAPKS